MLTHVLFVNMKHFLRQSICNSKRNTHAKICFDHIHLSTDLLMRGCIRTDLLFWWSSFDGKHKHATDRPEILAI